MSAPLAIATSRLRLRWLTAGDADFVLRLVNDAEWLRFIGDKGARDLDGARRYIETGPAAMYREFGFGLNRVALGDGDRAIGICGLLRRATLAAPDLGFARRLRCRECWRSSMRKTGHRSACCRAWASSGRANIATRPVRGHWIFTRST